MEVHAWCGKEKNVTLSVINSNFHCLRAANFDYGVLPGNESDPIYIDRVNCTAKETDINNCTYFTKNQCSHDEDLSLVCNGMYEQKYASTMLYNLINISF